MKISVSAARILEKSELDYFVTDWPAEVKAEAIILYGSVSSVCVYDTFFICVE